MVIMKQLIFTVIMTCVLAVNLLAENTYKNKLIDTSDANTYLWELAEILGKEGVATYAYEFKFTVDSSTIKLDSMAYNLLSSLSRYEISTNLASGINSIHCIQNEQDHIRVDTALSLISFEPRLKPMQFFLKIDLLDRQFIQENVKKMYAIDSLGLKVIKIEFKPASSYLHYSFVYDTSAGKIISYEYTIATYGSSSTLNYEKVKTYFSGWTFYGPGYPFYEFLTDKYFTRKNGLIILKPQYADYEILDNSAY